ncbi:SLC13 family permease [Streptomyces sp. NPDC049881]|uniref:SLC13 family permease n=1 Tax=unclassified Streptomyces TaxID=2593676 RepID=UPI00343084FB
MSPELISILVLAVVFVVATTRSINMGVLAFAAAFGVGELVADLDADGIFAGFPGDLFVVLVGITYLFAIARANGTTDWLVRAAIRLVGGRIALIPWVMFVITAALTGIGALSPAAVAIVAPIALSFAQRYGISPLLMGGMVIHGAQGGGFSPISIYGSIVNGIVDREGLPGNELVLFLASLVANLLIATVLFVTLGGTRLSGREDDTPRDTDQEDGAATGLTPARAATLAALAALVFSVLVLDLDAGLTAVTLAVVLNVFWPDEGRRAVSEIAWSTVLLICGVLTYVGVLEEMGTITWAGNAVGDIGVPLLAAVVLCYIGALISAFASSVGIMGALIPLAVPFLAQGEIGAVGMVAALAVSATVVDVSPFSTNGALVLAAAPEDRRERFFRQLMMYGGAVVAVVPAAAWLVLVVPGLG